MANVKREDRVSDTDIKRLNHIGLGLKAIADELGCHPATITLRLKAMDIKPTDTRRSFMEQVYSELDEAQKEWLSHNLFNAGIPVKTFISSLIKEAFESQKTTTPVAAPAPLPEMDGSGVSTLPEPPTPDELTVGEFETGGASEKPDLSQSVEPEKLVEVPETKPESVPEKPRKLDFGKK